MRLISYPQLRASWGRTALVVGGIATGVTLIVAINVINTSVLENFRNTIDLIAGPAALEVTLGVGEVGFSESTVDIVRGDADVAAAVPLVRGTISLADEPGETLQLFGADLTAEEELQRYQISTANRAEVLRGLEDPRSILLTTVFASRHGVGVGGSVKLSTPEGIRTLTVRGLLETEGLAAAFGGQLAVMDLPAAQLLLGKEERIDQIDLVLRQGADVGTVQRRLEAALPDTLSVARPAQRGAQYESIFSSFQAMLAGLSSLCLVAGIYIVYNTTSTGAVRRAMTMAGLRLVGADAVRLYHLLMLEALVLGTVGVLLGFVCGVVLAQLLSGMVRDSMGVIFQLRFSAGALAVNVPQQIVIGVLGLVATVFASHSAAHRVAAMEPLDVIRSGIQPASVQVPPRRLVTLWAVLVVISVAALVVERRLQSIAWGNFGSTLWNASVIVIAIPLVSWLAEALSRVLPRFFGAEGRVAAASLFRAPTRTGVTVAAVALVLTVAITIASLSFSFHQSTNSYVRAFLASGLSVSAVATEGGWLETPLPERLASEIREVPGVRAVEVFRALPGQIYRGRRIGVLALSDGFFDPTVYPTHWYREGDPTRAAVMLRAGQGVNISTGLADRFDLHVGDLMELDTPTGRLALPIVGVVPDLISDRGTVLLSRRLFVERWLEPMVSRIHVFLDSPVLLDAVRSNITERFGREYRLKVLSLREVFAYHTDKVNHAFAFTDAIQLLVIVVTIAGIFDLLLSSISERRRELAVWRLIGADERVVRRSVVIESATIGALGAVLGVAVGIVTAWTWIGINFRYLLGYYLEYHLAVTSTAWYVTLVMSMTMIAGFAAAHRATRQSVLQGIRTE